MGSKVSSELSPPKPELEQEVSSPVPLGMHRRYKTPLYFDKTRGVIFIVNCKGQRVVLRHFSFEDL